MGIENKIPRYIKFKYFSMGELIMLLCVDCEHCSQYRGRPPFSRGVDDRFGFRCNRDIVFQERVSLVTGEHSSITTGRYYMCEEERTIFGKCGPEGKYFKNPPSFRD